MNEVIVLEQTPILIPNPDHKNFTETDKLIPKGTTMQGEFKRIEGLRKGKPFIYRLFIDKDGLIVYEKNVKMNTTSSLEGTQTVTLPSTKKISTTHAIVSVLAGVIGYAVAKKMGKSGKTAFIVAGISAVGGYMVANQITNKSIIYQSK